MNVATTVEVGGSALPFHLRHVRWQQELHGLDRFCLTFSHSDLSDGSVAVKDVTSELASGLGKLLTLRLGYYDPVAAREKSTELRGIVTGVRGRYSGKGMDVLVEGAGAAHVLDRVIHTRTFQNMTWDQIVREVARPGGKQFSRLEVALGALGDIKVPFCCQYQETDFAFLRRLCASWGWIICASGNELIVRAGREFRGFPGHDEVAVLVPGANTQAVSGGVRSSPVSYECGAYQYYGEKGLTAGNHGDEGVKVWTAAPRAAGQGFTGTGLRAGQELYAEPGSSHEGGVHWGQMDTDHHAERWAQFLAGEGAFFEGCTWVPALHAGAKAKVGKAVGVGVDWVEQETLLVTRIVHTIHEDEYRNEFEGCALGSPKLLDPALFPPRARFVTIPGRVTRSDDASRVGRVLVQPLPLAAKWLPETVPARVAHRAAGSDHGELLQPEVGDEVLLALHPDAFEEPVVICVLYNGTNKTLPEKLPKHAGLDHSQIDKNDLKWQLTRGGNAVIFDDTSGKERILVVSRCSSLVLSEDSAGPHMTLTVRKGEEPACTLSFGKDGLVTLTAKNLVVDASESVTFKAGKDFVIDAGGKISLKAGADFRLEAAGKVDQRSGTDTKIDAGTNATVKGAVKLKLSGGAQSELTGGATTTIKGGLVRIN